MNKINYYLLNNGANIYMKGVADLFGIDVHSFSVGDAYGFVTEIHESTPRGNLTFLGDRNLINFKSFDNERSVRISMIIPEQFDNIAIGNLILYAKMNGQIKPVVSVVLSEVINKQNPYPDQIAQSAVKYPGNRLVISITLKYVTEHELDTEIYVNVVTPTFSNLPVFGDDSQVPNADVNPYPQFVVNNVKRAGGSPALVAIEDGQYWSAPLWQNILSPKYGIMDGGVVGEDHTIERKIPVWGGWYWTDPAEYKYTVGGMDYEATLENVVKLGGAPY